MKRLPAEVFRLGASITVYFMATGQKERIPLADNSSIAVYEHKYCVHNEIVCFVTNEKMYVAPTFDRVMNFIRDNNFTEWDMYVPFSDNSVPVWGYDRWKHLLKAYHEEKEMKAHK